MQCPAQIFISLLSSITKAFQSPLLVECNSNSSANQIAKVMGEVPIRYGVSSSLMNLDGVGEYAATKIAFGDPGVVYRPSDKFLFAV